MAGPPIALLLLRLLLLLPRMKVTPRNWNLHCESFFVFNSPIYDFDRKNLLFKRCGKILMFCVGTLKDFS